MIRRIFMYLLIISTLMFSGCGNVSRNLNKDKVEVKTLIMANEGANNDNKTVVNELTEKIENNKVTIKSLEEERDYYKNLIKKLTDRLSEKELVTLAKEEWKYKLKVDGKPIENISDVSINKSNFEIILSESQPAYPILSEEISNKGKISGESYREHIKFTDVKPAEIGGTDGTVNTAAIFKFVDVPNNTTVKIELSKELQSRLGLDSNIIRITVKQ
jgi:hypothetical protein